MSTDPLSILIVIVGAVLAALIGAAIGKPRGVTGIGAVAGLLLGPIGWLGVWLCYPARDKSEGVIARTTFRTPDQAAKDRAWRSAVQGEENR